MKIQVCLSTDEEDDEHRSVLERTGFWGKRAAGVIFMAKATGRFMLAHRSRKVLEPNTWGTWGGAIDRTETPIGACLREIKEEASYLGSVRLFPLYVFEHGSGFKYFNFLAIVPREFQPKFNWETQGSKWVEFGDWPQPLHPGAKLLLQDDKSLALMKNASLGIRI